MPIGFRPEETLGKVKRSFGWRVAFAVAIACALLGFVVYALTHRYTLVTASDGSVYQTDRLTGKTWRVEGQSMKEVAEATPTPTPTPDPNAPQEIPLSDTFKLRHKGDCLYKYGDWRFEGTVENPTDWTIDEIQVLVAGETYEFRSYMPPGLSTKIQIDKLKSYKPSESDPSIKCSWMVFAAKGRKSNAEKKGSEK